MRRTLFIVCLLALPFTSQAGREPVTAKTLAQQKAAPRSRPKPAEITAIEAYCKGLDQYFKSHPKSTRFFVEPGREQKAGWHEVKNEEEMMDAEREYANQSITVSTKKGVVVYAVLGEPMEHSRHDSEYYFRSDGTLAKISSGYWSNMAEMHVERENFYDSNGTLLRSTSQCFHISPVNSKAKEQRVSCRDPQMREEIENYQLHVYKRNMDLPAYSVLKKG
jgi:hypothetical protein